MPNYTLTQLQNFIDAELLGDGSQQITGVASLGSAQQSQLCFLVDKRHIKELISSKASAVLTTAELAQYCDGNRLIVKNPRLSLIRILKLFYPDPPIKPTIHSTAIISENVQIGNDVAIGPYVVIEDNVVIGNGTSIGSHSIIQHNCTIGANCRIYNRVTCYPKTVIGDRVEIHSGVVLGADGFGLVRDDHRHWYSIPQIGRVRIGNDVLIGANTVIDCGALDDTVVGDGVKIDDMVMLAHNVIIGDHSVIAGCSGIAGSTQLGKYCMIGAGAGLNGHITLCDNVFITAMGMIQKDITEPGIYSSGTGMQKNRDWHKSVIWFWQLDKIVKRLKRLERLQNELDGN